MKNPEKPTIYYLRSDSPRREHFASTSLEKVKTFQRMFPGSYISEDLERE